MLVSASSCLSQEGFPSTLPLSTTCLDTPGDGMQCTSLECCCCLFDEHVLDVFQHAAGVIVHAY